MTVTGFRREQMRDSLASGQPGFFRDSEIRGLTIWMKEAADLSQEWM